VGCYIWYSEDGSGRVGAPPSPLLAVPNVTTHPSTASVPTSYYLMWNYNCLWTLKGYRFRLQISYKYIKNFTAIFFTRTISFNRRHRRLHSSVRWLRLFVCHGNAGTENIYYGCRRRHHMTTRGLQLFVFSLLRISNAAQIKFCLIRTKLSLFKCCLADNFQHFYIIF